ncbi:MAG: hypothetical protein JOZ18_02450, partial [Chloroflexi bacterium]|nr:hypothetical protein [Chloroflexota bacterium]
MGLIRLAIYMLTRHVGRIIAGALLLVFGLIIGVTSHNVGYQHLTKGSGPFDVHVLDNGDIYIQDTASQTFYIVHEADFTPTVDTNTFPSKSSFTSLIYDNDSQSVDVKLTNGNQLSGTGYAVEQFAFVDTNGQNEKSFSTSNYQQNPNGFYQNNWPGGGTVAGAGALLLLLTFLMKRSKAPAYAGVPAAGAAMMQNQWPGVQPPYAQYPGIPPQGFPPNAMPPQGFPPNA